MNAYNILIGKIWREEITCKI